MALPVEGALAPDPADRRLEPLRELPGARKAARTWKDEVRERVRDRRRQRSGDLPLFSDVESSPVAEGALDEDEPNGEVAAAREDAAEELAGDAVPSADVMLREPRSSFEDDHADLTLREREEEGPLITAPAARSRPVDPFRTTVRDPIRPTAEDDRVEPPETPPSWSMGDETGSGARELRPVERPAFAGERARAALLDVALLGGLWALVVYFASRAAHVPLAGLLPAWPYLVAFLALVGLAYGAYFTGTTGQTPGKLVVGLRVVDSSGRPPGVARAAARALVGAACVLAAGAGLVPILLDPARRGLHDRLLKTRVVRD